MVVDLTNPKVLSEIVKQAYDIQDVTVHSHPFTMSEDIKEFSVHFRIMGETYKEVLKSLTNS